jgi:hypothetical protein
VELSSFPRKALTSIFYEAGPSALQHFQLRSSDIMLKGMWVRFVLELVASVSVDYDWSNTLLLFMNVVNGALLLHGEDQTILYYSLVTILTTVTKFNPIFMKDGYQMIIPTLIQVRGGDECIQWHRLREEWGGDRGEGERGYFGTREGRQR